jgi:hypothetical protein
MWLALTLPTKFGHTARPGVPGLSTQLFLVMCTRSLKVFVTLSLLSYGLNFPVRTNLPIRVWASNIWNVLLSDSQCSDCPTVGQSMFGLSHCRTINVPTVRHSDTRPQNVHWQTLGMFCPTWDMPNIFWDWKGACEEKSARINYATMNERRQTENWVLRKVGRQRVNFGEKKKKRIVTYWIRHAACTSISSILKDLSSLMGEPAPRRRLAVAVVDARREHVMSGCWQMRCIAFEGMLCYFASLAAGDNPLNNEGVMKEGKTTRRVGGGEVMSPRKVLSLPFLYRPSITAHHFIY